MKKLHRLILTSKTYQQSARGPARAGLKKDPENRLLWRMPTRRLDAEQIRDAILAVTGKLDLTVGRPERRAKEPRRSIYLKLLRNTKDPLLDVFDCPRLHQHRPAQRDDHFDARRCYMLNSPFMLQQAQAFAARLLKELPTDEDAAHRRSPSVSRLAGLCPLSSSEQVARNSSANRQACRGMPTRGKRRSAELCPVSLKANDFVYAG